MIIDRFIKSKTQLLILCVLLGFSGCFDRPEIIETEHGIEMKNLSFEINEIREVPWKVGNGFIKKVSKGLTLTIQLPELPQDKLEEIHQKLGVDSWVVRVVMIRNSNRQEIGSAYAPFKRQSSSNRVTRTSQVRSISFSISYAASAISERFRSFICPAFSHNRRIDNKEIKGSNELKSLVVQSGDLFNDKPVLVELTPSVINAGHQLVGDYYFDVGLYRSKDRRLFSRLIPLSQYVSIMSEELVNLSECAGVHLENDPPAPRTFPINRR